MLRLFVLSALCLSFVLSSVSKEKSVPENVKNSFTKKFPNVKKMEWEFDKEDNLWEVEFKMNKEEYEASFNEKGEWLETEKEIRFKDLPNEVKSTLELDFKNYEIEEVEYLENSKGQFYEVEVEIEENNIEKEYEIIFSKKGELIDKKEEKEEDDKD